jgi:hypothetical protein
MQNVPDLWKSPPTPHHHLYLDKKGEGGGFFPAERSILGVDILV